LNISKLSKRQNTYHYRSRVPQQLHGLFRSNGHDPIKVVQLSLKTKDLTVALARRKVVDDWVETGGVGIVDFVPARQHYLEQLGLVKQQAIDPKYGIREPMVDPTILDGLQQGMINPNTLTAETLAAIAATLSDATGQPPPAKYSYTLRDALTDYRVYRQGDIREKTLAAYDRAVDLFLGQKSDVTLDAVKSPEVALWIDGLIARTAHATRVDHVNRLAKLFSYSRIRGYCAERLNPFENHQLGMPDAKPVQQMSDTELLNILKHLRSDSDRAWSIIARHSGMRLAEVCHAKIVVIDGVVCFDIKELVDGQWSPKTDASTRVVPIRKSLINYAREFLPQLKKPRDYSKRFGNVKKKLYPDKNRTLVFHSLRHTFTTFAYQAGYNEQQVSWVTGHVSQRGSGESAKRYMHGYSLAFLSEVVESIPMLEGYE